VLFTIPFVNAIWQLVIASLILEIATLMWSPAKEATVPNLVPASHLTTANSLSLVGRLRDLPDRDPAVRPARQGGGPPR
jgi:dTMP kinase